MVMVNWEKEADYKVHHVDNVPLREKAKLWWSKSHIRTNRMERALYIHWLEDKLEELTNRWKYSCSSSSDEEDEDTYTTTTTATTSKTTTSRLIDGVKFPRMLDYSGEVDHWWNWKQHTERTLRSCGYQQVLEDGPFALKHPQLDKIVYWQLVKATEYGFAYPLVYNDDPQQQSGHVAWQNLCNFYDAFPASPNTAMKKSQLNSPNHNKHDVAAGGTGTKRLLDHYRMFQSTGRNKNQRTGSSGSLSIDNADHRKRHLLLQTLAKAWCCQPERSSYMSESLNNEYASTAILMTTGSVLDDMEEEDDDDVDSLQEVDQRDEKEEPRFVWHESTPSINEQQIQRQGLRQ